MSSALISTVTMIDPAILDTILGRLALLFLTGAADDIAVARHAAARLLAAYKVETDEELSLAAEIISFGYHALQALSQAMDPDLPLNKVIRLRGSAVSLSREGHRNQRKLDQLQRDRRAAPAPQAEITAPQAETTAPQAETTAPQAETAAPQAETTAPQPPAALAPASPDTDMAIELNAATRQTAKPEPIPAKSWTQAYHDRQRDKRLAEAARKRDPLTFTPALPDAAMPPLTRQAAIPAAQAG